MTSFALHLGLYCPEADQMGPGSISENNHGSGPAHLEVTV